MSPTPMTPADVRTSVAAFLASHPPEDRTGFLRARFDAGLAWLHYPVGLGGLGASRALQPVADEAFAGTPDNEPRRIAVGLGMAAPTLLKHGTAEQRQRYLRPLWTGEEVWCQLFSEPGAGSDLAGLACAARKDRDDWVITGQKVWTSQAHYARWGILLARTDPDVPKHQGLTFFICDMRAPGVTVRPLRQLTGEAEFNEVFLDEVRLEDTLRLGEVGEGWSVARTTLMNERVSIGGDALPREGGAIGALARMWREQPELRRAGLHDAVLRAWVRAEAVRLTGLRLRQQLAAGEPGPEGSAVKLAFAGLLQEITSLELELGSTLRHDDWRVDRGPQPEFPSRTPTHRYLRARGSSIEGGTSEILRTIIGERVLGLPAEPRSDLAVAWRELPR
ncbi:MAG: acyl-CoA dehydrogenase [Hamadaea sp.]|uniref:acyl-CoA dehydrogenase family protein n=1 Tax=Hamadaea sp. TaxID=2024425 RepID=UPI00181308EE|nr:acyl-CoA dehydrogenase family protein [Hamadaea sp.]NUR74334.1 acyl-CoA dehydrogenase [Hamadaea sp.]NUT24050.1 acyl-CoA dehydrogenase [Hamadaea sp.]